MPRQLVLHVPEIGIEVAALLEQRPHARWMMVLAHGAGAGMRHAFMENLARALADVGVATLQYEFPYMQSKRRRPDSTKVLTATVRAAIGTAAQVSDAPLLAGGKSLGGRMTSHAFAEPTPPYLDEAFKRVRGLVFDGFPLHQPGQPDVNRAEHLGRVPLPMLFLQGTRDALADLSLLRPLCEKLEPLPTLHVIEGADHSFHVPKRSGRTDDHVVLELAQATASFADALNG
jgi:uncharacterized protein